MISGHGANPIFFNKKIKIRPPPHPLRPITSCFCLITPPPLSNWTSYVYHPLEKVYYRFRAKNRFSISTIYFRAFPNSEVLKSLFPDYRRVGTPPHQAVTLIFCFSFLKPYMYWILQCIYFGKILISPNLNSCTYFQKNWNNLNFVHLYQNL